MLNQTLENLTMAKVSKEATLLGLQEHAQRLADRLETTLHQIDELKAELEAINELQTESSGDPETQDHPNPTDHLFSRDLEPVNPQED